jgi:hypothetical protein
MVWVPNGYGNSMGWYKPAVSVPSGFVGVGDVQSGASAWYGLRAYNASYATGSNPAIDILDQAGANALTVNILANGDLDVASIASWVTAHSVTTIKVSKVYDQIGTNHCIEPSSTLTKMPTLILSGLGSKPELNFDGSVPQALGAATSLVLSTFSISSVAKRTSGTSIGAIFGSANATGIFFDGANTAALFNGSVIDFGSGSVTDGTFWTVQAFFGSGTSKGQYDATSTTLGDPGTQGFTFPNVNNSSFSSTMRWKEGGVWSGDKSATFNSVNSNAKAYWGY